MRIANIRLVGFRNFRDASIDLPNKALIIGANDVGKSNLLHALRIVLDRSLSEADIEPRASDFHAHSGAKSLRIVVRLEDIVEECVLAKLKGYVSDDGNAFLCYEATINSETGARSYRFLAGHSEDALQEIEGRTYLKTLSIRYVGSTRDFTSLLRREKGYLLEEARKARSEEEKDLDSLRLRQIGEDLTAVNGNVKELSYIAKATDSINKELRDLSHHNGEQEVVFDAGAVDTMDYVDNLNLASRVNDRMLVVGGDGRRNQIFVAVTAARHMRNPSPTSVTICCVEEPEAHLHPHQQRQLARHLFNTLPGQVILTTHSPHIACEFPPESIIRLYDGRPATIAAGGGPSLFIDQAFNEFGYRLNVIPAEAFFATVAFLVEGTSEVLFYKALASAIGIDLDRLNVSVLSVEGVGFAVYAKLMRSLSIPYIVRTDNDIFKVQNSDKYRLAGLRRCLGLYRDHPGYQREIDAFFAERKCALEPFPTREPSQEIVTAAQEIAGRLEAFGIFLAGVDLENDLRVTALGDAISEFFPRTDGDALVKQMQKQKATFMYDFLKKYKDVLDQLQDDALAKPLYMCEAVAKRGTTWTLR